MTDVVDLMIIEAVGWHNYMIALYIGGRTLMVHGDNVNITWDQDWPIERTHGGELAYYCRTVWRAPDGRNHQCDVEQPHKRHRCECGRTKAAI